MKTKYETLKDIIRYVENESDDVIGELLEMGFTPCQLVYEFGFDEEDVRASENYEDYEGISDDRLDDTAYPFVLDNYNPFDAAIVNWFQLSKDSFLSLKDTEVYKDMKAMYDEEKIGALNEVLNDVFNKYEQEVETSVKTYTLKREN